MEREIKVDEKLIKAFHLMFDHFPEGAQLAHKSKRVIAVNPACRALGREPGMICSKHGPAEAHKGCLAAKMVQEQKPMFKASDEETAWGWNPVGYWIPVDGHPDFFIHFGIGHTADYSVNK